MSDLYEVPPLVGNGNAQPAQDAQPLQRDAWKFEPGEFRWRVQPGTSDTTQTAPLLPDIATQQPTDTKPTSSPDQPVEPNPLSQLIQGKADDVAPNIHTRIFPHSSTWGDYECNYKTSPLLGIAIYMPTISQTALHYKTAELAGMRGLVGKGSLLTGIGALQGALDGHLFYDAYQRGDKFAQYKYGTALLTDVGMMAPLANLAIGGKASTFAKVAMTSAVLRQALYLVPDEINKKE